MINCFRGEYYFLSNFYECNIEFDGIPYLNAEAAFQAQKCSVLKDRKQFSDLNPSAAKKLGRKVSLRPDWENVKINLMYQIVKAKFVQNPDLADKLIATGDEYLEEGNNWGDRIWGTVNGVGANNLGKILMTVRSELRESGVLDFDPAKTTDDIVEWIKNYFEENANPGTKAVIGISGGKDSSVAAALCVKALGRARVIGVLMPQGEQADIDCSKELVEHLGIKSYEINIGSATSMLLRKIYHESDFESISSQANINTPARIRMTTLYAVAANLPEGGRVVNTCNLSEDWVGYSTKFGDGAGDFSPLSDLTVTEILQIGDYLGLPYELVHKTPIDGLCGKTDEDNLGFTYAELDRYIRGKTNLADKPELKDKIDKMHKYSLHKLMPMPKFEYKG